MVTRASAPTTSVRVVLPRIRDVTDRIRARGLIELWPTGWFSGSWFTGNRSSPSGLAGEAACWLVIVRSSV
ncbi:MAG: hypothetical protein CM1200mP2_58720 [Planctomycetaceae bacterium]|nr:MAG: hypothetical protein CM1200mP2_58720 [Planctomycetaceae bacterium]